MTLAALLKIWLLKIITGNIACFLNDVHTVSSYSKNRASTYRHLPAGGRTAGVYRVESTAGTKQDKTGLTHKSGTSETMLPPFSVSAR